MAYEESNYEIVKKNEVFEIRKYSDRLAVETIEHNQNSGFRKLFNYISGNNKTNEEIKMTTPVTRVEKNGNMTIFVAPFCTISLIFFSRSGSAICKKACSIISNDSFAFFDTLSTSDATSRFDSFFRLPWAAIINAFKRVLPGYFTLLT